MNLFCLDDRPYDKYGIEAVRAARNRGHQASLFRNAAGLNGKSGYVFARLAQWEPRISYDKQQLVALANCPGLKTIQDPLQIACYENKILQAEQFAEWMPETWIFTDPLEADEFASRATFPLVSKSSVGSASKNVRILRSLDDALAEIALVFGDGMPVSAGAGNDAKQRGYVLWQQFIPHDVTFRVTRVGDKFHCYMRYNYDDRPVAAPSRVKQTRPEGPLSFHQGFDGPVPGESLASFAKRFTDAAGTKWCAMDILWDRFFQRYWLLETALAWARGDDPAGNAPFYGTRFSLLTQHELLIEEIERGAFG